LGEVPGVSCQHFPQTTARVFLKIKHPSGEEEVKEDFKQSDYVYE
jgi:hypothetical protein